MIITGLFIISFICATKAQTSSLTDMLKADVSNSMPSAYPSTEPTLVSQIDTSGLHFNSVTIGVDDLDNWFNTSGFDPNLLPIAWKQMEPLKYSSSDVVFIENFTQWPSSLTFSTSYLMMAGTNVNSSISMAYWYGDTIATCIQQTYWQDCCDGSCAIGDCRTWIHLDCNGCNQPRSDTASEIFDIKTSNDVATRSAVLNAPGNEVKQNIVTFEVTEDGEIKHEDYEKTRQHMYYFNKSNPDLYPSEWFVDVPLTKNLSDDDELADTVMLMGNILKQNISDLGTPQVSEACKVNTCLGFDYFQVQTVSAHIIGLNNSYIDAFLNQTFDPILKDFSDENQIKELLADFKYAKNVSWIMNNMDFSSINVTKPGFAHIWKRTNPTHPYTSDWLISYIYGEQKISEDIFVFTESHKYLFGLLSDSQEVYVHEPHKISPEDVIAMELFYQSILHNCNCEVLGLANCSITFFPNLDC